MPNCPSLILGTLIMLFQDGEHCAGTFSLNFNFFTKCYLWLFWGCKGCWKCIKLIPAKLFEFCPCFIGWVVCCCIHRFHCAQSIVCCLFSCVDFSVFRCLVFVVLLVLSSLWNVGEKLGKFVLEWAGFGKGVHYLSLPSLMQFIWSLCNSTPL